MSAISKAVSRSTSCLRHDAQRSILSFQSSTLCRSTYATAATSEVIKPSKRPYKTRTTPKLKPTANELATAFEESTKGYTELPPEDEWKSAFPTAKEQAARIAVRSAEVAKQLAEAIAPAGSKDLIIMEASPGPGALSRALLNLPKERIKKLILVDPSPFFLRYLEPLATLDPRVSVFPFDAFNWSTYTKIIEQGSLDDVQKIDDWSQIHPQLRFVMTMSGGVHGEQMASQLLRAVSDRQWLFQYGRVPMNLILQARMYDRLKAEPYSSTRCKVSIMAQAAASVSELVPYNDLQPYHEKFHPSRIGTVNQKKHTELDVRRISSPLVAIQCIPLENPLIERGDLEFWDYCLRKMFVQKATPVSKSITSLGPGANNLLKILDDPNSPNHMNTARSSRELVLQDWRCIINAFKEWPFRPSDLSIDSLFMSRKHD